ncbi:hypothetical protein MHM_03760 [Candidatus Mycoplasma haemominutum 'Birmingham 1']|uniref:Uncharacterized protein n=1 Tax=Candidatus Mycoplasma haematominutum 'Birmingham 1' TaxID=1116213 RepID=G8C3J6_9MOLU|nr:hypothetical protein MHM_03760 [Candidatus Mycoplasma haematominutum 'Birmingham 1']
MLSRRTKLLGGAALLLGAPSSTALSTLDVDSFITTFTGGGDN